MTVTGNGFDPISTVVITFGGSSVSTVTPGSSGGFTATFNVPLTSSNGPHTVKATQGGNSDSETFTVTALTGPIIFLDPDSGPVGSSVDILGAGFAPNSVVTITFNGSAITPPAIVTTTPQGLFSANFTVPSPVGIATVLAIQGANTASKTFIVTSSLPATLSNFRSIESRSNQSNASSTASTSNQSNYSVPVVTNNTFDAAGSNGYYHHSK